MPLVISVGLVVVTAGCLAAMRRHQRQWSARQGDAGLSQRDQRYYARQYQRRMQASAMLAAAALGLLVGYHAIDAKQWPALAVLWMVAVMGLAVWVFFLAAADWIATRHFLNSRRERVEPTAPTLTASSGNGRPVANKE